MKFSGLAIYLERLEKTASRNEMTLILADIFRQASAEEIDKISYLLLGVLLPAYKGVEFNMAEKMMVRALASAFHLKAAEIGKKYKSLGDLGNTAYEIASSPKSRRREEPSVTRVYDSLMRIAREAGRGSQEKKIKSMAMLFSGLDKLSLKFIVRIPLGKMRLGFSDATILDALSTAEKGDKSARALIERAYNATADIGTLARHIKERGLEALKHVGTKPGVPVRPSLAERLKSAEETIKKAGPRVGVEKKLDGFRTQLHVWKEKDKQHITLFSRNLENTTAMFPEIVASARGLKVQNVILDGETIGYRVQSGKFTTFQETVQRKRKHEVEQFAKKIPLHIFIFDILHLDGKSLIDLPFRLRRKILEDVLPAQSIGSIMLSQQIETEDPAVITRELKASVRAGLEGLVVKNLEAPYQAGSRGFHWIKLKATTAALENLRSGEKRGKTQMLDTVDCVIMGIYKGRGKRAGFGVGGFLLGIKGADDKFYTLSRLGTGLSDEQLREAKKMADKLSSPKAPKEYVADKEVAPDVWVKPALVAEILADEITLSPRHTTGRRISDKIGYSLRFPRLVRFRNDKNPQDATTVKEIEKMYKAQIR